MKYLKYINEEYDNNKNEFEIGDRVVIISGNMLYRWIEDELKGANGFIIIKKIINDIIFYGVTVDTDETTKSEIDIKNLPILDAFNIRHSGVVMCVGKQLELYKPEDIGDMEQWEDETNEEYNYEEDEFEVDDDVIIMDTNDTSDNIKKSFDIIKNKKGKIVKIKQPYYIVKLYDDNIDYDSIKGVKRMDVSGYYELILMSDEMKLYEPEDIGDMEEWDE